MEPPKRIRIDQKEILEPDSNQVYKKIEWGTLPYLVINHIAKFDLQYSFLCGSYKHTDA